MSKIASYLGEHLRGEVMTGPGLREAFSTDGSILKITPLLVVYPFNTSDVRKLAHFAWQLAEKGHILPLTARGAGTSRVGAAIGSGAIISFPTHMHGILEVDTKQKLTRLQPGVTISTLQEVMRTHGLVWPIAAPFSRNTIGGVIANNVYGELGGKYGHASEWIDQLEVVISNGDIIQTGHLSKRELNKKKGLSTLEGEIYRQLDGLLTDNEEVVFALGEHPSAAGYALAAVKDKKGGFNLTPLIAGSQGTLGVVTEAILKLDTYHPNVEVVAVALHTLDGLEQLIEDINKLSPSRFEFIDHASINYAHENHGVTIDELTAEEETKSPAGLLVIEFNDAGRKANSKAKKAAKILHKADHFVVRSDGDFDAGREIWQIYHRIEAVLANSETDNKTAIPLIEDAYIPLHETTAFIKHVQTLAKEYRIKIVTWGHIGSGVLHARPLLSLRNLSDKQKVYKLTDEYYKLVVKYGGSIAGEYGEGRLRTAQALKQFNKKEQELMRQVKQIFDMHGVFNPGVKLNEDQEVIANKLNEAHSPAHLSSHLPRL